MGLNTELGRGTLEMDWDPPAWATLSDYETLKTCLGGEQMDSNHRLMYTCACASPQKCRAAGLLAAVKSHLRTVRF